MNAIEARRLFVKKSKTEILHGLDITIKTGSLVGLIGPSGSGKTTLMRSIVGVQAYGGDLSVLGQPAGHKSLRQRIGYVSQNPAVYSDITVAQNIAYFATVIGAPKLQAETAIKKVQLESHRHQLVSSLSGGQRARVSLAVALLGDPEILVLDEPTVGLDPILRDELWGQFNELVQAGRTLIISSHVMDEADRCDNVLLMRDGRVLWNDTRLKLLQDTQAADVNSAFIAKVGESS
ncbi:MAG: ABC transporter ATP-binding protein [bacterium]|nr:ABC transporter ATP-binding protein [bacterium]